MVQADLADPQAVRRMVDEAAAGLGGLDVLVNNAGIYEPHPITDVSYEQWQAAWRDTLGVNLIGAANATWCAVRHMIPRGGGRIINVTSRGAFRGEPRHPAYGASKAGLNAFGQSMARHLAPYGIAVASVAPGYVETDMTTQELASSGGDAIRGAEPVRPGGKARGDSRGGALPGVGRGRMGQRHGHRPERRLLPALTSLRPRPGGLRDRLPAAGAAPVPAVACGASHSTPSGGTVSMAEAGWPCQGSATASTTPRLPTPLPP